MMNGMPLKTCWASNERWINKFYYKVASCWLFLLSHITMHGSMNIKFIFPVVISTLSITVHSVLSHGTGHEKFLQKIW
jgi:hypothetical protein